MTCWLMYCRHNRFVELRSKTLQRFHRFKSQRWIKAGGWFLKRTKRKALKIHCCWLKTRRSSTCVFVNRQKFNNILHQPPIRLVQLAIHRQCSPVSSLLLTTLPSLSQHINCNYYCKYLIIIVIIIKQEQRWRYKNEKDSEDTHLYQDILSSQND